MTDQVSIGFVGLGNMGLPMARHLVESGHRVVGFDVAEHALDRAAAVGVEPVTSLAMAGSGVGAVILMLPSSDVVERVLGDEALLGAIAPGTLIVDMSSSEPLRTKALAAAMRDRGLRMLDAPVSGGVSGAEKASLTIMVGGEADDLESIRPTLEAMGRVRHAGAIGSGHAVKSLNNLMSATHLLITAEAIRAGERFGLDPAAMLEIFNGSSGRSASTEDKFPAFVLPGTYNSGFALALMVKDMKIAVDLARAAGTPSVLGEKALSLWSEAAAAVAPDADHMEIVRWLEDAPGPATNGS